MSGTVRQRQGESSSFLQVALDRFSSPGLLDFIRRWKIDMVEVESLKRTSDWIQTLSDEAEIKQFTNDALELWLDDLKQLLYDAEDILDEYATEILRMKLESESQTNTCQTQRVRNPFTLAQIESSVFSWPDYEDPLFSWSDFEEPLCYCSGSVDPLSPSSRSDVFSWSRSESKFPLIPSSRSSVSFWSRPNSESRLSWFQSDSEVPLIPSSRSSVFSWSRPNSESHLSWSQSDSEVPLTPSGKSSSVSFPLNSGIASSIEGINNETLGEKLGIAPEVSRTVEEQDIELQGIKMFYSKVRDINEKLISVGYDGVALGLNGFQRFRVFSERPPTSSLVNSSNVLVNSSNVLVNSSNVFGRDEDKWKIIEWLLADKTLSPSNNDINFSVLPIVGMGGVGKTTLAQLVYNDEIVQKHFQLKAWVCVSEDFDVVRLTKEILECATGSSPSSNSLDVLQMKLKEELSNKRFLLVLDDMWNEDYYKWDALKTPFAFGKPGSKILVTTRSKEVSSIVRTGKYAHHLKVLSKEACFALFRRHAFSDESSSYANQKAKIFGAKIVKKCGGIPLVVKTFAGLLRYKKENSEWHYILEDEIWDLKEGVILPSLMLVYQQLPPLLKRCFAYCALFPKGYVFSKIELVTLWMAEGIVHPKGRKRLEEIGAGYFDELFRRSFFELSTNVRISNQLSPFLPPPISHNPREKLFCDLSNELHIRSFFESSSDAGSGFVMHDLIHDLAEFVLGGIYCRRELYDNRSKVLFTTRHLSYVVDNYTVEATEFEEPMKSLRTLLTINDAICTFPTSLHSQFQFLRVLRFRYCCDPELLDSIGKLKHLRLLDLSFSDIVRLPNSIGNLYNLQTLVLTGCWELKEFPEDMCNLVNLRHLFLPTWSLHSDMCCSWVPNLMPLRVGNLTSVQTLSTFVVASENSGELRDLSQLRGTLDILFSENVVNNETTTMVANLKNKPHLLGVRLRWGHYVSEDGLPYLERDEKVQEEVLDQQQPHTNLQVLWIENYGGTRFPSWMGHPSFSNIEAVFLVDCYKCMLLPHLWQLPLLKHLVIHGCSAIKIVGSELYRDGSSTTTKQFRSLKTLRIGDMEEWEEWPEVAEEEEEGGRQFPCLNELMIANCPKLKRFFHCFPSLVELVIEKCDDLRELPQLLPKLRRLHISQCPKLVVLPSIPSIESLHLEESDQITSSSSLSTSLLQSIESLHLEESDQITALSSSSTSLLPSFESLHLEESDQITSLSSSSGVGDITSLQNSGAVTLHGYQQSQQFVNTKPAPHGLFGNMKHLRFLDLSTMSMKVLPHSLVELRMLETLKICHNRELVSLPNDIHKLECLHDLDLRGTGIRVLPSTFGELFQLRYLDLSHTPIEMLPESVIRLERLRTLILSDCSFLSGSFHYMIGWKNIQCLDLSNTGIELLPEFVSNLDSLERLMVEGCSRLAGLPSDMGKLSKGIKYSPSMTSTEAFSPYLDLASSSAPSVTMVPLHQHPQPRGQYSPSVLLDNQLDSYVFRKMKSILEKPEEMGLGDITHITFPLLQLLHSIEMFLDKLRDAALQKLGDPAKQKCLEHQPLFEGLGHILKHIAFCVSDLTTPLSQLPLQGYERDEAFGIINAIYDNSDALRNISLQLETVVKLVRFASSENMAQMGALEMVREHKGLTFEVDNISEACKSFHYLPQHLKRCVIYTCILFPDEYEFEEVTLIQLWIAVGFIRMGQEQQVEWGRIYFKELDRLKIFQSDVYENYEPTYRVDRDVYELIKQQYCDFPNEFAIMEEGGSNKILPVTLHATLLLSDKIRNSEMKIFERFYEAELLRTLKLKNECRRHIKYISHNLFVKLRFLRVLDLSSTEIKELPTFVCNLKHLRYLDVSSTRIRKLPESLCKLYNLETLKLKDCLELVGLPNEMSKLINLQYLDLNGVHQLTSMPPRMGQLTNLHTLSTFIVGKEEGFRIEELKYMKKLKGSLCIENMENATKDQANEAQLSDKDAIHKLEFQWSLSQSKGETEFNLIEPHLSIKWLKITRYGAESFPNWLSSDNFHRLTVIHLRNCNCTHLPYLGKLPLLKSLYIHEMYSLKEINHEFCGHFMKLEVLVIDGMPSLEKWTAINMPSLRELTIIDCPKLVTPPGFMNLKSLQHLKIILCPEIKFFRGGRLPKSLQTLTITKCLKLEEQFQKGEGKWSKIMASIPEIWIAYQQIPRMGTSEQGQTGRENSDEEYSTDFEGYFSNIGDSE